MKQDKFLTGILAGIALLIILSLALFFIRKQNTGYLDENTPAGIAQDYVTALQLGDYERAYTYLAEDADKPTLTRFREDFNSRSLDPTQVSVEIRDTTIQDDTATVYLTLIRSSSGMFSQITREPSSATLQRVGDTWAIQEFPYPFWGWEWYTKPQYKP